MGSEKDLPDNRLYTTLLETTKAYIDARRKPPQILGQLAKLESFVQSVEASQIALRVAVRDGCGGRGTVPAQPPCAGVPSIDVPKSEVSDEEDAAERAMKCKGCSQTRL